MHESPAPSVRITPNLFGIATGIAATAGVWAAGHRHGLVPGWPADALYLLATAVWLALTVAWARQFAPGRRSLAGELRDPVYGPFVALLPIGGMVLGAALSAHAATVGRAVFGVSAVVTLLLGGWLSAGWIAGRTRLGALHSGYLLPTAIAGLVAAGGLARTGSTGAARTVLAAAALAWVVLGSIVLARLLLRPALPAALVPTLAIEVAPPMLAGNAYLAVNDGRVDPVVCVIAGYALVAVLVQCLLARRFRRIPFGPGVWAFAFPYATTAAFALHWTAPAPVLTVLILGAVTAFVGTIAVRTVVALRHRTFLPAARQPVGSSSLAMILVTPSAGRASPR